MQSHTDRRAFLLLNSALVVGIAGRTSIGAGQTPPPLSPRSDSNWPGFPQQDPALAREMVGASHGKLSRVKALLAAHPALAKASYDWGYGDWESALGAASHVGNREIAALLLEHGARLDIFAATMLGMTEVVKATLAAQPALARTRGPHGISLVAHALAGENEELATFLKGIDGAGDAVNAALTPEEMKAYLGTYAREGTADAVIVSETRFGMAMKAGGGGDVRLTRTGEHAFHPAGVPNMRITFTTKDGLATRVEIAEDTWFVSALR